MWQPSERYPDPAVEVLDAAFEAGLSGPGRAHDLILNAEAVTPGDVARGGAGLEIAYGFHPTPFGECLIGVTERGICHLGFVQDSEGDAIDNLVSEWQKAEMSTKLPLMLPNSHKEFIS